MESHAIAFSVIAPSSFREQQRNVKNTGHYNAAGSIDGVACGNPIYLYKGNIWIFKQVHYPWSLS